MASPLSVFRKYQYIFLVVFGVMLMIAFVVAPPLDEYLRSQSHGGPGADPVVVKWKGGEIRQSDLEGLRLMHRVAVRYMFSVVNETQRRGGTPRGVTRQFGQVVDPGIPSSISDEALVQSFLLAQKGEAMGLVVTDDAVLEFLQFVSDEQISRTDMERIFYDDFGDRFSPRQLIDQLRVELLAQRVRSTAEAGLFLPPFGAVLPAEAWNYFQRLNRQVAVELVALPVADFASQVTSQPSAADIKNLFEEGKNRFPNPESPEPGFKRLPKAAFQFVRADFNQLLEEEKAKLIGDVTDEQIEQHYEQNKNRLYREEEPPAEEKEESAAGDDKPADEKPADDKPTDKPAEEKPAEEKPADDKPAAPAESTPDADQPPPAAADKDTPPASSDSDSADKKQAADEAADDQPKKDAPEPDEGTGDDEPSARRGSPAARQFFVSSQEPAAEPPPPAEAPPAAPPAAADDDAPGQAEPAQPQDSPDEKKKTETPPAPPAPAAAPADEPPEKKEQEKEKTEKKQPEQEKSEQEASDPPPPATAAPAQDAAGPKPAAAADQDAAATAQPPVKYRPLDDKLREEIREEVARIQASPLAQERLENAFSEVRKAVSKRNRAHRRDGKPGPISIDELAAGLGLKTGRIPLVDAYQVRRYELGGAFNSVFMQRIPFYEVAFSERLPLYQPETIDGETRDVQFLYWKTDTKDAFVPKLADARDEVVAAWKRGQARQRARDKARQLRDKAAKSKAPLAEALADDGVEVRRTEPFSWMTTGLTPGSFGEPEVSQVEGVENGGEPFMEAVFALGVGQVGVALNQPQSVVYVVRVRDETPGEEELRQRFLASGVPSDVQFIAYTASNSLLRDWYQDLEAEMQVEWLRDPEDPGA